MQKVIVASPPPRRGILECITIPMIERVDYMRVLENLELKDEEDEEQRSDGELWGGYDKVTTKISTLSGKIHRHERRVPKPKRVYNYDMEGKKFLLAKVNHEIEEHLDNRQLWKEIIEEEDVGEGDEVGREETFTILVQRFDNWNSYFLNGYQSNLRLVYSERISNENPALHFFTILIKFFYRLTMVRQESGLRLPLHYLNQNCSIQWNDPKMKISYWKYLPDYIYFDSITSFSDIGKKDLVRLWMMILQQEIISYDMEYIINRRNDIYEYMHMLWLRGVELLYEEEEVDILFGSIFMHFWHYFHTTIYMDTLFSNKLEYDDCPPYVEGGETRDMIIKLLQVVQIRVTKEKDSLLEHFLCINKDLISYVLPPGLYYLNEFIDDGIQDLWTKLIQNDTGRLRLLKKYMNPVHSFLTVYITEFRKACEGNKDLKSVFKQFVFDLIWPNFNDPEEFSKYYLSRDESNYFDQVNITKMRNHVKFRYNYMGLSQELQNYYLLECMKDWYMRKTNQIDFYDNFVVLHATIYMNTLITINKAIISSQRNPIFIQWNRTGFDLLYKSRRKRCGNNMKVAITQWLEIIGTQQGGNINMAGGGTLSVMDVSEGERRERGGEPPLKEDEGIVRNSDRKMDTLNFNFTPITTKVVGGSHRQSQFSMNGFVSEKELVGKEGNEGEGNTTQQFYDSSEF